MRSLAGRLRAPCEPAGEAHAPWEAVIPADPTATRAVLEPTVCRTAGHWSQSVPAWSGFETTLWSPSIPIWDSMDS